jgi:hypothetical protein
VLGEHAGAGAARRHDVVAAGEGVDRAAGDRLGVGAVAGIERRLAAAGLLRHDDLAAGVLQQLDRGEADGRAKQVDETGDEQADAKLRLCRLAFRHVSITLRADLASARAALVARPGAP